MPAAFVDGEFERASGLVETRAGATVVHIRGPIYADEAIFFDSYPAIRARVEAAMARPEPVVVLAINSPGGEVSGCFELARTLREMADASGKKLVAWAGSMACSAAYALATAADVIAVPPTGAVGSVGCIRVVADQVAADRAAGFNFAIVSSGARKLDGNPHAPIDEGALEAFRSEVDDLAGQFFDLVAARRGTSVEAIAALDGAVFTGPKAVAANLADLTCDNLEKLLAMVASGATPAIGVLAKPKTTASTTRATAPRTVASRPAQSPAKRSTEKDTMTTLNNELRALRAEKADHYTKEVDRMIEARPDLDDKLRARLRELSPADVATILELLPAPKNGEAEPGSGGPSLVPQTDRNALDRAFGCANVGPRNERNRLILPAMTAAEARAEMVRRGMAVA